MRPEHRGLAGSPRSAMIRARAKIERAGNTDGSQCHICMYSRSSSNDGGLMMMRRLVYTVIGLAILAFPVMLVGGALRASTPAHLYGPRPQVPARSFLYT